MSLLSELRRRNVFKVGAAYAIVGWLLAQLAEFATDTFGAPAWVLQIFVVFLVLGLPVALILAWAFDLTPQGIKPAAGGVPEDGAVGPASQRLNVAILSLVAIAVVVLVADRFVSGRSTATAVVPNELSAALTPNTIPDSPTAAGSTRVVQRSYIDLGPTERLLGGAMTRISLSDDGHMLAYVVRREGDDQLYVRRMDRLEPQLIDIPEQPSSTFLSPDGSWVGYSTTDGRLFRVPSSGGASQLLAPTSGGRTFTSAWDSDGTILFSHRNLDGWVIGRVRDTGGEIEALTTALPAEQHMHPRPLPGGGVLFTIRLGALGNGGPQSFAVAVLPPNSSDYRVLIESAYDARYSPTGHVIFGRSGSLWAAPFDLAALEISGPAVMVVDSVRTNLENALPVYAFSPSSGTLVYQRGGLVIGNGEQVPVWVDRQGTETPTGLPRGQYGSPRVSPGNDRLAVTRYERDNSDIWVYDLETGAPTRLTFDPAAETDPLWSRDGERIAYWSSRDGGGIYIKRADNLGAEVRLTESSARQLPNSFTPDGLELIYMEDVRGTQSDLYVISVDGGEPRPLLTNLWDEDAATLSPDGHWLAYEDDNNSNVYNAVVRPYPDVEAGWWQASFDRGAVPIWRADGRELFFSDTRGSLYSVSFEVTQERPVFGPPQTLLVSNSYDWRKGQLDVSPDGQRFLMLKVSEDAAERDESTQLVVVTNWFEELKSQVPTE